jgi:hypothetical protein
VLVGWDRLAFRLLLSLTRSSEAADSRCLPVLACPPSPFYPFRSVPVWSPLIKVCIGGGAGRGAGAGVAVGWLPLPADPLLLLTIRPFQFVHASLFFAQDPPPLSDDLHRGRGRDRTVGRVALPGHSPALRRMGQL